MRSTLKLTVDASAVRPSAALCAAAQGAPLLVITGRRLSHAAAELGSHEAAAGYLFELAESIGKPVAVNVDTGAETSSTAFIAPRSWTEERLQGWIGGHHAELEGAFGEVARVGNRATRRRRPREGRR